MGILTRRLCPGLLIKVGVSVHHLDMPDIFQINASEPVFERFGRALHLRIDDARDLYQVLTLNEAHWVATSAPVVTINADRQFLALLDDDGDGRIRVEEVRRAVSWVCAHLTDPNVIRSGNTELRLEQIQQQAPDGKLIKQAATKVRNRTGDRKSASITLEDVRRILNTEEEGSLGRPGLVAPGAAPEGVIREFLRDVLATVGGEAHPNEKTGVTQAEVERFLNEARGYLNWLDQGVLPAGGGDTEIMPLGTDTEGAYTLFSSLCERLDQYFALCRLTAAGPLVNDKVASPLVRSDDLELADAGTIDTFLAQLPIAAPTADGVLNLDGLLNPIYAVDLAAFRDICLARLNPVDPGCLGAEQWKSISGLFSLHASWINARPDTTVARLDPERLRAYLSDPAYAETVAELIQNSHTRAIVRDNLRLVEKLILYQAFLLPLANSFVSFPDLYDPASRALFEMGTLIMDGRHFTLSVRVPDRAEHTRLSAQSNTFILYVEIIGSKGSPPYEVAVPVTTGGMGKLQVGMWGIFQDIDGRERHARVVQIVENSISLYEAVTAPFKRLGAALGKKLQEITTSAEQKLSKVGTATVTQVADVSQQAKLDAPSAGSGSMLAGGGIAIAALGSSAAFITKTLSTLSWQGTLGGLSLAALAVILPTALFALFRLRRRDLSSLLEGSGWAINSRMWLTGPQARNFTYRPVYTDRLTAARATVARMGWLVAALLLVALAWAVDHFELIQVLQRLR